MKKKNISDEKTSTKTRPLFRQFKLLFHEYKL